MKIAYFDTHEFERQIFYDLAHPQHEVSFFKTRLDALTAQLAANHDAVCCFANDKLDREVLMKLKALKIRLIALRSAGYNHADLKSAAEFQLPVVRVPSYSPNAVAEHAVALMLTLNRKIHRSYNRVREMNFSLEGLVGFDMNGKTVGVVGAGRIGQCMVRIMRGFGCRVLIYDREPDSTFASATGAEFVSLEKLLQASDLVTLHLPLNPSTQHFIDDAQLAMMKKGAFLINTGRGGLINAASLLIALKRRHLGGAALDVYEQEAGLFFEDHSAKGIGDDLLARLITFPNVIVTSHQAFLTTEALQNISATTIKSLREFEAGEPLTCEVRA